jgi:PDZ domain-containing secreted protein
VAIAGQCPTGTPLRSSSSAGRRGDVTSRRTDDGRRRPGSACRSRGYDFPFDVSVNISDDIGGPSAGLMFSLGDLRHADARLADRRQVDIAGTGTITPRQGRPDRRHPAEDRGARDAGAELFLVPPTTATTRSRRTATCAGEGPDTCTRPSSLR